MNTSPSLATSSEIHKHIQRPSVKNINISSVSSLLTRYAFNAKFVIFLFTVLTHLSIKMPTFTLQLSVVRKVVVESLVLIVRLVQIDQSVYCLKTYNS